jgi:hypothetical protein
MKNGFPKKWVFLFLLCMSLLISSVVIKYIAASSTIQAETYSVEGKEIVDGQGKSFIPYGVQLDGILMAQNNWQSDAALAHLTQSQVQAAHDFWHANTVSLQLGSRALFARSPYDTSYLDVADKVVAWTKNLHMNVLFVLQYEGVGNSGQPMPTQDSLRFWNVLSRHYAGDSNVFFDIFNEPNPAIALQISSDNDMVWSFWQNGGRVNGTNYIGMQQLVGLIRQNGFENLIFVDGVASGEDINLLPHHTLVGSNLVYAIHPYLSPSQHGSPMQWDDWFGHATDSGGFPVEADEWSQYQNSYDPDISAHDCLSTAPTLIPQFLSYLRSKHIGVIGYALFPGTLIRGWNFTEPTAFDRDPETCPLAPSIDLSPTTQGAGRLLVNYFATYSQQ